MEPETWECAADEQNVRSLSFVFVSSVVRLYVSLNASMGKSQSLLAAPLLDNGYVTLKR